MRELGAETVQGRVVAAGRHDEIGASPFVVVKDQAQVEHYARLAAGRVAPEVGAAVELKGSDAGLAMVRAVGRSASLER